MHPVKPYHRKPEKGERVWIEIVKMHDIAPGADPAKQTDSATVGASISDGWVVMYPEPHDNESRASLAYADLINTATGQGFEVVFWPELKIPENRATPSHVYHLSFATLGGAQYSLGYDTMDEAVAAMVDFSTYRNVFRLTVMRRGMSLCEISWLSGDKVLTDLDQYHQAVSWGDTQVVLANHAEEQVSDVWMEPAGERGEVHMGLICPVCGEVVLSLQDMRGSTVVHTCSPSQLTKIWISNDVKVLMEKPATRPTLPNLPL